MKAAWPMCSPSLWEQSVLQHLAFSPKSLYEGCVRSQKAIYKRIPKKLNLVFSCILGIRSWEEMALSFIGLPHWGDSHLSQIAFNSFPLKYSSTSSRGPWFLHYAWDANDFVKSTAGWSTARSAILCSQESRLLGIISATELETWLLRALKLTFALWVSVYLQVLLGMQTDLKSQRKVVKMLIEKNPKYYNEIIERLFLKEKLSIKNFISLPLP